MSQTNKTIIIVVIVLAALAIVYAGLVKYGKYVATGAGLGFGAWLAAGLLGTGLLKGLSSPEPEETTPEETTPETTPPEETAPPEVTPPGPENVGPEVTLPPTGSGTGTGILNALEESSEI